MVAVQPVTLLDSPSPLVRVVSPGSPGAFPPLPGTPVTPHGPVPLADLLAGASLPVSLGLSCEPFSCTAATLYAGSSLGLRGVEDQQHEHRWRGERSTLHSFRPNIAPRTPSQLTISHIIIHTVEATFTNIVPEMKDYEIYNVVFLW